jgi:hypothetical protein
MSNQLQRLLRGWMAVGLAASSLAIGAFTSASPAGGEAATPAPFVRLPAGASPHLPAGARFAGRLADGRQIRLDVILRLPDPDALRAFVAALSDPRSPYFHRFLKAGQFGPLFGPSEATVAEVERALRATGLTPGPVARDHLAIPVVGTVGDVERAFHTSLAGYRLPNGRIAYANAAAPEVPANIAPLLAGVLGLNDLYAVHSQLVRAPAGSRRLSASPRAGGEATSGPQPCSEAADTGSYTANELAAYYGMSSLYGLGDLGQGVHIAVAEFEPDDPADIAAYQNCYRTDAVVDYTEVDGGAGTGPGGGEAALDIEDLIGLAPRATIDVYQAPNSGDTAAYDLYDAIVTGDDPVVSTSWGECELDSDPALLAEEQTLFTQAATQGETVVAAAGDTGSTDCLDDPGTVHGAMPSVDDPASQPGVVGVGGTSIQPDSEDVWNDNSGSGGGGVSATWCMPAYEDRPALPGVISADSQNDAPKCGATDPYLRQVPDVSADADPYTGYAIYYDGSWDGGFGGTSAAAPLWAAVAALTDSSPFCSFYGSGTPGALPGGLYAVAASAYGSAFYDVTGGNNDYTPSKYVGGLYPATKGYDMASGLGTPLVTAYGASGAPDYFNPGFAALMCHAYGARNTSAKITAISPASGLSTSSTAVRITGSGFLPLAGADQIEVGARWLTAVTCTTTTSCTATVSPSSNAGVVGVRIDVEDLAVTNTVQFTYNPVGYWLASADGQVSAVGNAAAFGGVRVSGTAALAGIAATPGAKGYWLVGRNGAVYPEGDAHFEGDLPAIGVEVDDIVAIASTGDGRGYWLIGADGGEFAFGDARYHGSVPGVGIRVDDIVGMVATSDGGGYWMVGADGGVFAFGDAHYVGSLPGLGVHVDDVRAMIASPTRGGYILVGGDGGTFILGSGVHYFGSLPGHGVHVSDIVGLALTPDAQGYWLAGSNGATYAFGDGKQFATPGGAAANLPIVAIAS